MLKGPEKEHFVLDDGATECAAELIAPEVFKGFPVGGVCGQRLRAEIFEQAAMHIVASRLGDDVDHATSRAAEFCVGTTGDHLKFFYRVKCDVDRGTLTAELFTEKTVVVVAAIEADVVEYAALAIEVNLIAVRPLSDGHARRQCQEVFKLASEDRRAGDGAFVQGRRGFRLRDFDRRNVSDDDSFSDGRNFDCDRNGKNLAYRK